MSLEEGERSSSEVEGVNESTWSTVTAQTDAHCEACSFSFFNTLTDTQRDMLASMGRLTTQDERSELVGIALIAAATASQSTDGGTFALESRAAPACVTCAQRAHEGARNVALSDRTPLSIACHSVELESSTALRVAPGVADNISAARDNVVTTAVSEGPSANYSPSTSSQDAGDSTPTASTNELVQVVPVPATVATFPGESRGPRVKIVKHADRVRAASDSSDEDGLPINRSYVDVVWKRDPTNPFTTSSLFGSWRLPWKSDSTSCPPAPDRRAAAAAAGLPALVRCLEDGHFLTAVHASHARICFDELESYFDGRPELARYTVGTEVHRMRYQVLTHEGILLSDPIAIRRFYDGNSSASAASCCGQCELLWCMANQSLPSYLLKPLQTELFSQFLTTSVGEDADDASSPAPSISASQCQMLINIAERTLRCECTLEIACECDGERLEVARCNGLSTVRLEDRTFLQSVTTPSLLVLADGRPVR